MAVVTNVRFFTTTVVSRHKALPIRIAAMPLIDVACAVSQHLGGVHAHALPRVLNKREHAKLWMVVHNLGCIINNWLRQVPALLELEPIFERAYLKQIPSQVERIR